MSERGEVYQKDVSQVIKDLNSSSQGLSSIEVKARLKQYGKNSIEEKKELNILLELLSNFKSPLVLLLIIVAGISAFLHQTSSAIIIGLMVVLSVVLNFFLEHNAQKAAEKLKLTVKAKALVWRDGKKKEVHLEELCPGDIIELNPGNMVPADCRLLTAKYLFVNQSVLTGESYPSEKKEPRIIGKKSLIDQVNMLFMGTSVVSGNATAIIVKTGMKTEFGKIAKTISKTNLETEFEHGIKDFGYLIMKSTLFLVILIFLFNALFKQNLLESFMFSLAVAVGLTPELLPMIMSVTMARGSIEMAKKGTIVKKLSCISNFGSMDILCTDKTGTLTEDKIRLVKYMDVQGKHDEKVLLYAYLNSSFHSGIKNPLDDALVNFRKVNVNEFKKIDEIPFDFIRKRMSVAVSKGEKEILITKGAPEEVFKVCSYYHSGNKKEKINANNLDKITRQYHFLSEQGYRVLAIAIKEIPHRKFEFEKEDESNMTIVGFAAFFDPPKKDVSEVIKDMQKNGIEVKILTGDNELVTKKVCQEIGLKVKGVLLGYEIDSISDKALENKVENVTIFARFSPQQKSRIIQALRNKKHVVGYLGDGINDAPALNIADIGISVSSAVDVAKESADIVLTHKSLKELHEGIMEGRKTFGNTIKYILMGLSSNFGNMFSVAVAVLFLPFLPMLPIQIILNNFIYDFSQVTIPFDSVDKEYMVKPKRWNIKFIKRFMLIFGPISSLFDIITFLLLWLVLKTSEAGFHTGWFIESLATQTLIIHFIRTKRIPFMQSTASKWLLISTIVAVAIGWIIPYTFIGKFFEFEPLPWFVLLIIGAVVLIYFVMVELVKKWFYKKYDF
ncbi:MAG: magnesium-translocating P-type ATPase [Candidatus Woesearchaeota archaeon]